MCLKPQPAGLYTFSDGSRKLLFKEPANFDTVVALSMPCRQCIECRISHSREWAVRCMHEVKMHPPETCHFLTLTYAPEHLPPNASLQPDDLTKFFKRARKRFGPFRYFACGEYGDRFQRPHYHFISFGLALQDLVFRGKSNDFDTFVSPSLSQVWPFGHVLVAGVSFESCAYVARYITKKRTGPSAAEFYRGRVPPFVRMSRRPGIGASFVEAYTDDLFGHDMCMIDGGIQVKMPRYYDKLLASSDEVRYNNVISKRVDYLSSFDTVCFDKDSFYQLDGKAAFLEAKFSLLHRTLEL